MLKDNQNYFVLHNHSEHSLKNSPTKVKDLVQRGKELNCEVIGLSDISSMTGIIEFIEECRNNKIKGIPGIEAVMNENLDTLVLLARNYEGYQEINRAFKEANNNIFTDEESNIKHPLFSFEILEKFLHKQNVIVISSGINSIISKILLKNATLTKQIEELKALQKTLPNPYDPAFIKNNEILEQIEKEIAKDTEKKKKVKDFSKKAIAKKMAALEGLKNTEPELYKKKKIALDKEILEIKDLNVQLPKILARIEDFQSKRKALKLKLSASKKKHKKYNDIQIQVEELEKQMIDADEMESKCTDILTRLKNHFENSFYIGICYHNSSEEKDVFEQIFKINKAIGVPYIITNDTRFLNKGNADEYQLIKSMEKNDWTILAPSDKQYYFRTDDEINKSLDDFEDKDIINTAKKNSIELIESLKFSMYFPDAKNKKNKHYPKYIPLTDDEKALTSDKILGKHIEEGLKTRGLNKNKLPQEYIDRISMEFNVINEMGFCDYLLIVEDYIKYGKSLDKNGVGPGRGSAAGSLICYLLEITNIDPIKYGLKFERFLNKDRVSMPDIDTDFSAGIRYKVTDYVKNRYGEQTVAFIRTKQTQKGRATIRNVARVLGVRDKNDKLAYHNLADSIAKVIPSMNSQPIKNYETEILAQNTSPIACEIVKLSETIEGSMTTISTHAAGVIIGDGLPLTDIVPVFYNTEMEEWTVSCDMVEAENIGLLKMDFLGLNNLDIISETVARIKKYENIDLDMNTIPFKKEVFEHIYSEGKTKSVFQFESKGMRDMLIRFKPDSFDDIILLNAAYRPGPMDFLDDIIKTKNGELKPNYCVKELEGILSSTYGYPIYQEQLMDIFAICAGFSQGEADIIRRYMSKKKVDAFKSYKDQFINGLIEHGAKEKDAEDLWESLVSFSAYAFNKSHATAYAWVSYQTAYLKYYYPEYYMCSVLNNAKVDKLTDILYECREMNIKVLLPDINRAYENFENTRSGIVFGLTRIKNIKNKVLPFLKERQDNGAYRNFKDFVIRTRCSNKIIDNLIDAGCFDAFREKMRNSYHLAYNDIIPMVEKRDKILKMIEKTENKMCTDEKLKKAEIKEYNVLKEELEAINNEINAYTPSVDIEDTEENLATERELLGSYISGHPLNPYEMYFRNGRTTLLSDIEVGEGTFAGMIKNIYYTKRKSDGKDMAFFTLEDISGVADVNCFAKEYELYKDYIYEGNVVEIQGKIFDDDILKIKVNSISHLRPFKNPIFISVLDEQQEKQMIKNMKYYEDEDGHPLLMHRQDTGDLKYIDGIYINQNIVKDYANKNGARVDKDGYYIQLLYPKH